MKNYSFIANTPFEFEIKDLSEITQAKRRITGIPHRANFYQIIWIEEGKSVQTVDFSPIEVAAGQILYITKNQVVSFDISTSYKGKIILFTDFFFSRCGHDRWFMKKLGIFNPFSKNVLHNSTSKQTTLLQMIENECLTNPDAFQHDVIHQSLSLFLIETARQCTDIKQQTQNADYQIVLKFSELVEEHFASLRKVSDYQLLMNISTKLLSQSLQKIIGKTPKQYIDERILLEAKRLLVYTNESIKEITFSIGFDEPTNFSKFFRENVGMSPVEFKKRHLS